MNRRRSNRNKELEVIRELSDRLRSEVKLNAENIVYIIEVFVNSMFEGCNCISIVDPGFLPLYMKSYNSNCKKKRKLNHEESEQTIEKRKITMASYFNDTDYDTNGKVSCNFYNHKSITVIPIHDEEHWSLLVYFNDFKTFYHFDSLDPYHSDYVTNVLHKIVTDEIIKDTDNTNVIPVALDRQKYAFECGHYVFMCLYGFLKVVLAMNSNKSRHKWLSRRNTLSLVLMPFIVINDIDGFNANLEYYIKEKCCENNRMGFINILIEWIHNKNR